MRALVFEVKLAIVNEKKNPQCDFLSLSGLYYKSFKIVIYDRNDFAIITYDHSPESSTVKL
jgi:hypothetical protein